MANDENKNDSLTELNNKWMRRARRLDRVGYFWIFLVFCLLSAGVVAVIFAPKLARTDIEAAFSQLREQIDAEETKLRAIDMRIAELLESDFTDVVVSGDDGNVITVGSDGSILLSRDGGRTWDRRHYGTICGH